MCHCDIERRQVHRLLDQVDGVLDQKTSVVGHGPVNACDVVAEGRDHRLGHDDEIGRPRDFRVDTVVNTSGVYA
jgi:hypothetical protein